MKNHSISVIIPTYNGENFIAEAIESVLSQTVKPGEIIVVDDGSNDRTEAIVANLNGDIRFISQQHTGAPAAGRNRGVNEASGNYIAFLDQDDIWPLNALEIHLKNLEEHPEAMVDFGKAQIMKLKRGENNETYFEPSGEERETYLLSGSMIRKKAFDLVGPFDETMKYYGSDLDWVIRVREQNIPIFIHDELVLYYRMHLSNHSADADLQKHAMIEVFKRSMDRRRKNPGNKNINPLPFFKNLKSNG